METRVCRLYGEGDLRLESDTVSEPGVGEVLLRIGRGGICGSDLHYYQHGGFGPVRVREPIILGHEFSATVAAIGPAVSGLEIGDRVAVNPSQPCGQCEYCRDQKPQHCLEMRFIGSAMRLPHEQGGFRQLMIAPAVQCVKGANDCSLAELAIAEPLSVCLHAADRAGSLDGKKVLVNGAGPIGALCTAISVQRNAAEVVVVDLFDKTLEVASAMGATETINLMTQGDRFNRYQRDKGYFDIIFECSAAQAAMNNIFTTIRPLGTLVQVGVSGEMTIPMNLLVGKEVNWIGTHRFHHEFKKAVELISSGAIDVRPMISSTFPMKDAQLALEMAGDRSQAVKVQICFND